MASASKVTPCGYAGIVTLIDSAVAGKQSGLYLLHNAAQCRKDSFCNFSLGAHRSKKIILSTSSGEVHEYSNDSGNAGA
jgi:hypothetical protein